MDISQTTTTPGAPDGAKIMIQMRSIYDTSSEFPVGETRIVERIHVMIVMCNEPKNEEGEEDEQGTKMLLQAETLLKTIHPKS